MTEQMAHIRDLVAGGRLCRNLAEPKDVAGTMQRVLSYAVTLSGASVTVLMSPAANGRARVGAASGADWAPDLATALRAEDHELWQERTTVVVDDLHTDPRWPGTSAQVRLTTPARSMLTLRLDVPERFEGMLALAGEHTAHFTTDLQHLLAGFADHAAVALAAATQYGRAENLVTAVHTNRTIGSAVGIMMCTHKITEQAAFDQLVRASQRSNTKLAKIAEVVMLTGALPGPEDQQVLSGTAALPTARHRGHIPETRRAPASAIAGHPISALRG